MGTRRVPVTVARLAALFGLSFLWLHLDTQAGQEQFILAKDGKANAVVVVPAGAPSPVQFAAYELTTHLEQMTGAKLEVVKTKPQQGNAIILGENRYSRAAGIDVSKLKRDGYAILVKPDAAYIVGRDDDNEQSKLLEHYTKETIHTSRTYGKRPHQWHFQRATLYGVYRFLEELGVRWLYPRPDGTIVPRNESVRVRCMTLQEEPVFEMRAASSPFVPVSAAAAYACDPEELKDLDFNRKECDLWRLRQRFSTMHMAFNHRIMAHAWEQRFAESNPQYFALMKDGKRSPEVCKRKRTMLCYTNEGVYQETMKDVEAFFSGKRSDTRGIPYSGAFATNNGWSISASYADTFSLLPNDSDPSVCQCEHCRKRVPPTGTWTNRASGLVWPFVTRVAKETEKRSPGKKIVCLAYSTYSEPPAGMKALPENVIVGMCPHGLTNPASRTNPAVHERYLSLTKQWHAMNGQPLLVWDHFIYSYFNRDKPGVPMVLPHYLARFLRDIRPYVRWVYLMLDTDAPTMEMVNRYVCRRLLWNPDVDVDELLDDYFTKLYGPAAPMTQSVMKDIEAKSEKIGAANAGLTTIWDEHYPENVLAGYRRSADQAVALAKGTAYEEPTRLFSKYFVGAMEKARADYVEKVKKLFANRESQLECPRVAGAIKIDGDLSDEAWKTASLRKHFYNIYDGGATEWPTHLRIAHDDRLLYVAFVCFDPETSTRSAKTQLDNLEIFLKPPANERDYYWFMVNIDGSFPYQGICHGGEDDIDLKWKSHAQVATKRHPDRWVVEMAIPLEHLGHDPADVLAGDTWRANFCRSTSKPPKRQDKYSGFSPVLRGKFHNPELFGAIRFGE